MEAFVELMSKIIRFINVPGVKIALCIGLAVIAGTYLTMVGRKETWSRVKKNKVRIAVLLTALTAVFIAVFLPAGLNVPVAGDCESISPLDWENRETYREQDLVDVKVDFAKKERISLGFLGFRGKYGFRKELVVKEPVVFSQGMPPDFDMEHIRFGIYRDKELTDPIDEADAGYNFNASWHMEEGAEYEDYPEYQTQIQVILEPGTYYAAVYSTSPFDNSTYLYESWYDILDDDLTLEAGKYQYFYPVPGGEYEFPFTVNDNTEIVLETAGIAGTLTLYDTDGETAIKTLEIDDDQPYKESKKHFTFEKGGTYYFRLTDYPEEAFKELNYGWGDPQSRWLRYKVVN